MQRLARNHLANQAADRRSHHDLASRVGPLALNLPLQQVGRAEQASHEDVDRPIVELLRRTDLNDSPRSITARRSARASASTGSSVKTRIVTPASV